MEVLQEPVEPLAALALIVLQRMIIGHCCKHLLKLEKLGFVLWKFDLNVLILPFLLFLVLATIAFAFLLLPMCQYLTRPCSPQNK